LNTPAREIRVNAIGSGAAVTPINPAWIDDPENNTELATSRPERVVLQMASTTAFPLSDESGYTTGQTLFSDGGLNLYPTSVPHDDLTELSRPPHLHLVTTTGRYRADL
jgi:glucose 1-dehydrogenase